MVVFSHGTVEVPILTPVRPIFHENMSSFRTVQTSSNQLKILKIQLFGDLEEFGQMLGPHEVRMRT